MRVTDTEKEVGCTQRVAIDWFNFVRDVIGSNQDQSQVFVIFMSKRLSTNLCRLLRRLTVSYKGEISLHFDLPSLYSCYGH